MPKLEPQSPRDNFSVKSSRIIVSLNHGLGLWGLGFGVPQGDFHKENKVWGLGLGSGLAGLASGFGVQVWVQVEGLGSGCGVQALGLVRGPGFGVQTPPQTIPNRSKLPKSISNHPRIPGPNCPKSFQTTPNHPKLSQTTSTDSNPPTSARTAPNHYKPFQTVSNPPKPPQTTCVGFVGSLVRLVGPVGSLMLRSLRLVGSVKSVEPIRFVGFAKPVSSKKA